MSLSHDAVGAHIYVKGKDGPRLAGEKRQGGVWNEIVSDPPAGPHPGAVSPGGGNHALCGEPPGHRGGVGHLPASAHLLRGLGPEGGLSYR